MKLYDFMKNYGDGFDICDDVFDWGTFCPYIENPKDNYDTFVNWFTKDVDLIKFNKNWFSSCQVTEHVKRNIEIYKKFINEVCGETYTPKYVEEKIGHEMTENDEEFYDIYMVDIELLLIGSFSEKNYASIMKMIEEKEN